MAKARVEINPKSAERLKHFCESKNINQSELARIIDVTPKTISAIATQKTAMSANIAYLIKAKFNDIRVEWLMGQDEYMTESDYRLAPQLDALEEKIRAIKAAGEFLESIGYRFVPHESNKLRNNQEEIAIVLLNKGQKNPYSDDKYILLDPNGNVVFECTSEQQNSILYSIWKASIAQIEYVKDFLSDGIIRIE